MRPRVRSTIRKRLDLRIEQVEVEQYALRQRIDQLEQTAERAQLILQDCELTGELRGLRDIAIAFDNDGKDRLHV
jgi:hypothetical protein